MRKTAVLLSILILALIAACGQQEQDTPSTAPEESDATTEVTITNGLEAWEIHSILIDPSEAPWGDERLGEEEILAPGESFTLEITEGSWDIKVTDEDLDVYTLWQVEIGPEGYEWFVTLDDLDTGWDEEEFGEPIQLETGEGSAPATITNNLGDWMIYFVYVDPSDAPWGEDRLDTEILDQGDEITVWIDPGIYDLRVEDEDGDTYTLWEVDVDAGGYSWNVTLDDLDAEMDEIIPESAYLETGDGIAPVEIINKLGNWAIYYAYVDPSGSPWGEDRLESEVLSSENSIIVWVDPGMYDIRVEDEDGDIYTLWNIEVDSNGYTWEVILDDMD